MPKEGKVIVSGKWGHNPGSFGKDDDNARPGPMAISRDSKGNIWVLDQENHRIQIFSPSGKFLREISLTSKNYEFLTAGKDGSFTLFNPNTKKITVMGAQGQVSAEYKISSEDPVTEVWMKDGSIYVEVSRDKILRYENGSDTPVEVLPGRPMVDKGTVKLLRLSENEVKITRYQKSSDPEVGYNVVWEKKIALHSSTIESVNTDNKGSIYITFRNFKDSYASGEREIIINEVKIMKLDSTGNYVGDTVLSNQNENDYKRNLVVSPEGTIYQMTTSNTDGVQVKAYQIQR